MIEVDRDPPRKQRLGPWAGNSGRPPASWPRRRHSACWRPRPPVSSTRSSSAGFGPLIFDVVAGAVFAAYAVPAARDDRRALVRETIESLDEVMDLRPRLGGSSIATPQMRIAAGRDGNGNGNGNGDGKATETGTATETGYGNGDDDDGGNPPPFDP